MVSVMTPGSGSYPLLLCFAHVLCCLQCCPAPPPPHSYTATPSRVAPLSLTLCCLQCCPPPPHSYSHPVSCGTPLTHSVLFAVLPCSPSQLQSPRLVWHPSHSVLFAVLPSSPSQLQSPRLVWRPSHSLCVVYSAALLLLPLTATVTPSRVVPLSLTLCCLQCCPPPPHSYSHPVSCGTPLTHSVLFAVLPCSSSPSQLQSPRLVWYPSHSLSVVCSAALLLLPLTATQSPRLVWHPSHSLCVVCSAALLLLPLTATVTPSRVVPLSLTLCCLQCCPAPPHSYSHPVSCGTPLTHSVLFVVLPCSSSQLQSPRLVWHPSHSLCVVCSAALLLLTATVTPSRVAPLSLTLCCLQCCPPPPLTATQSPRLVWYPSHSLCVVCSAALLLLPLTATVTPSRVVPLSLTLCCLQCCPPPPHSYSHPVSCGTPLTHSVLFAVLPCSSSPSQLQSPRLVWHPSHSLCVVCSAALLLLPLTATQSPRLVWYPSHSLCVVYSAALLLLPLTATQSPRLVWHPSHSLCVVCSAALLPLTATVTPSRVASHSLCVVCSAALLLLPLTATVTPSRVVPLSLTVLFAVLPSSSSQLQSPRLVWYPSHSLCVVCSAALLPLTATVTPSRVVPLSLTLCCLQCCPPPPHSYSHPVSCGTPLTHSVLFAVLPCSPSQLQSPRLVWHPSHSLCVVCSAALLLLPLTATQSPRLVWHPSHSLCVVCSAALLPLTATVTPSRVVPLSLTLCCLQCCPAPPHSYSHPVSCGTPLTHSVLFAVLPCSSSPSQLQSPRLVWYPSHSLCCLQCCPPPPHSYTVTPSRVVPLSLTLCCLQCCPPPPHSYTVTPSRVAPLSLTLCCL